MLPDLAVLAVIYLLVLRPRWREAGRRTLAVRSVFCLYLVCVLGVTLLPVLSNLPLLTTNRTSDITDVIANTAGGLVGYLLFLPVGRPLLCLCREKKEPPEEG